MTFKRLEVWKEGFRWGLIAGAGVMVSAFCILRYTDIMKPQEASSSLLMLTLFIGFGGMFGYDAGIAHGHREMREFFEKREG